MSQLSGTKYRDQARTPVADGGIDGVAALLSLSARHRAEEAELAQRHHEERATLARQWGQFIEQRVRPLEQTRSGEASRAPRR